MMLSHLAQRLCFALLVAQYSLCSKCDSKDGRVLLVSNEVKSKYKIDIQGKSKNII